VTDKSPQPAAADTDQALDLEQELNALLGQIESANAGEAPAGGGDNGGAPPGAGEEAWEEAGNEDDELDRQIDRVIAGDGSDQTEPPPVTDDAAGHAGADADQHTDQPLDGDFDTAEQAISRSDDPLADQIQELLDEAKAKSPPEAPAADAPAQDASPEGSDGSDGSAIDDLDQMLAEGAEGAVGGEFESFDEVMGTADPAGTPSASDAKPAGAPAAGHASADAELAIDDEDAFAPPEQVLAEESASAAPAAPEPRGASAKDVARELDQQPEPVAATQAPAAPEREPAQEPASDKTPRDWNRLLQLVVACLRRICARVNRPLGQFPPEIRNTIGYVGLATLANAVVLILYSLFA